MNTSVVNIPEIGEGAPRSFDRNNDEISNISGKEHLVDIKYLGSTNFSQMKRPTLTVDVGPVTNLSPPSPTLPPVPALPPQTTLPAPRKSMVAHLI